jgi:hypothetical protein
MYLIFLRMKAPAKRAHYPMHHCLQLVRSAQAKGADASLRRKEYCAWKCKAVIDCNLFYNESCDGLIVEEKTNLLKEHLRTRLQHNLPGAVLA